MTKFTPSWRRWFVFFIGLHVCSLRVFTICPGLRGRSPSVLSAVHLNTRSGTHQVSHGERPRAWLVATGEQRPGDAANGTTAARRHGEGAARRLWRSTPATASGPGCRGQGSREDGCGRRRGRQPTRLPEAANTLKLQPVFLRKVKQFYSTG